MRTGMLGRWGLDRGMRCLLLLGWARPDTFECAERPPGGTWHRQGAPHTFPGGTVDPLVIILRLVHMALDNFQFSAAAAVNAVPEPASLSLAAVGLIGLAGWYAQGAARAQGPGVSPPDGPGSRATHPAGSPATPSEEPSMQTQFLNPPALCPTFGWTHVVTATRRQDGVRLRPGRRERARRGRRQGRPAGADPADLREPQARARRRGRHLRATW